MPARGPLDDYRRKRDFRRTSEPAPGPDARATKTPVFVVHRHEARNLHYDLRLELDGVLLSWAVPKGFSYDPADKRLAVRTEDHPIEYMDFEGLIPAGEYGAGAMTIWDHGIVHYLPEGDGRAALEKQELKLILDGRRLRGEWHLVKTKQGENHWLLFKSRDRYSGAARDSALGVDLSEVPRVDMPRSVRPVTAERGHAAFSDPDWLFEMEFAGRRAFAEKQGERVRLRGLRRGAEDVLPALAALRAEAALLDGVLVVQDEHGRPCSQALDERLAGRSDAPLLYYAFDLLHYDAFDLRPLPLVERKAALRSILPASDVLLFVDHVRGDGEQLAAAVDSAGLPGMLAKPASAAYDRRAAGWRAIDIGGQAEGDVHERLAANRPRRVERISNPDKLYWPEDGYSKADLVGWYETAAEHLLPYLRGRPIHMDRRPDGIHGKAFFQRHVTGSLPDGLRTEWIDDSDGVAKQHFVCDDRWSLVQLANLGSIDLHPWLSRIGTLDSPDWCIIDLDPKGAPFAHVVRIAKATGRLLRGIGMRPALKTSGKTGLHVYVPLTPGYSYEQVRMFAEMVARIVARELKDIATVERSLGSRDGKVYVDFGQNRRGATVVPPYVVRPVPGATVSAPLEWDELEGELSPALFTIRSMPARLDERGELFRSTLTDPQAIEPALAALEAAWRG